MTGRGHYRPMPDDFMEHCTEGITALIKRYHSSTAVVTRWKDLAGTIRHYNRPVIRIDDDGNEVRYENAKSAARDMYAGGGSNIYKALKHGGKSYGYYWRYADEDP